MENILTSLRGISKGNAAPLVLFALSATRLCAVPVTSHRSENHVFRSSRKYALLWSSSVSVRVNVLLSPFRKISIYSCSYVTYAPAGHIPDPMNFVGALVAFLQWVSGSTDYLFLCFFQFAQVIVPYPVLYKAFQPF